ncbi:MAG: hypothetical protein ACR2HA_09420 [Nocardioides sp.]
MEAVFIALMALVVLLSGWVSVLMLHRLFKADSGPSESDTGTSKH